MKKKLSFILLILSLLVVVATAQAAAVAKKPAPAPVKKAVPAKAPVKKPAPAVKGVKVFNDAEALNVQKSAISFIQKNLVDAATKVEVTITDKLNSLYLLTIKLDGSREVKSAMTADGKYFFPQTMDTAQVAKDNANKPAVSAPTVAPALNLPKADKPNVELFVMSYCPYGTQIEKGILPVAKALGDSVNFQIKFVDYAMHGDKEVTENLRQYCIESQQADKYQDYLTCFLGEADAAACITKTKIDSAKLDACVSATDKQYNIIADAADPAKKINGTYQPFNIYKADNDKYQVQGSPTLIINGQEANANRDSASLATAICGAFTDGKQPSACKTVFATATPAPGFGAGTTTNSTPTGCGQ